MAAILRASVSFDAGCEHSLVALVERILVVQLEHARGRAFEDVLEHPVVVVIEPACLFDLGADPLAARGLHPV
jgi:hypothetical protein